MLICRSNYESFLIDYLDNTLTPEVRAEVDTFLLINPDIAAEFDGIQDMQTKPSKTIFQNKSTLKKAYYNELGIDTESDYLCIAELEKDITPTEQIRLNRLAATNNEVEKLRSIYANTKLKTSVIYANKSQLKHHSLNGFVSRFIRVAAVVAIMISLFIWQRHSNTDSIANMNITTNLSTETSNNTTYNIDNTDVKLNSISHSDFAKDTYSTTSMPISNTFLAKNENIKETNKTTDLSHTTNQIELKEIKPIQIQALQISNRIDAIKINHRLLKSEAAIATASTQIAEQTASHTKEYTIKGLAIIGAQRLSNLLGLKTDVQYNNDGKVTRWKVEGNFIAFSSTNKKYENID